MWFCYSVPVVRRETSRRAYLQGIGATIGLTGVTTGAESTGPQTSSVNSTQQSQGADHPVVGVNPGRTGHNAEAVGPKEGVNIAWSVGGTGDGTPQYEPPPVLSEGTVYVRDRGSTVGYNAHTGEKTWSTPSQEDFISDSIPTVNNNTLFHVVRAEDGNIVAAVNIDSKQVTWKQSKATVPFVRRDPSSPVVESGTLFIKSDSTLYAIDATSGSLIWELDIISFDTEYSYPVSVHDGTVYVSEEPYGFLRALSSDRGVTQWTIDPEEVGETFQSIESGAAVKDNVGCVNMNGPVVFDPNDGSVLWSDFSVYDARTPPTIANGRVFIGLGESAGGTSGIDAVRAYDAIQGTLLWERELNGLPNTQPIVADGVVYIGTSEPSRLYALDAATGNRLWKLGFRTAIRRQPVISDGWAYVVTDAGELFGLRGEATGPPPVGPHQADPTDPDSDGQYEDVDGDGDVDVADVQTLYNAQGSSTVQSNTSAFDFNNSGGISIGDVQALFKEYLSR